ncbi:helicase-exonuclease AddAB subunit AddA [Clostridium oryzae]|uniref:ATP-dependent helicase/nuclease subunit A n=1 Tax=Clostridium oryzae TaxID=1450648 RepID=A0A1V4IC25_9CLOT|nr:helicase-exonuclease AddAB subunit AddA [Clostridium oryzae]OPJ57483.1 ATP-dependent helicase/nuclease subunit A [Clostridium oryzae]
MGQNKWTKEQESAIYSRSGNYLVAAAAGSGKTAVLVERIIKIITDAKNPIDIDRLLVVTFTNAAAAEMRERIGDAISRELDENPDSRLLQRQLTLINKANITTMHSFCLDVIKNNFHCIDLDPNFRIANETETILLKQETLQDMLERKYEQGDEKFINLVDAFGGSKDDRFLIEMISELYNFSMSGPWPEKWLIEKAEEFNVDSDFDIMSEAWGNVLIESIEIDILEALDSLNKAINICETAEGLEPYLDTLLEDKAKVETIYQAMKGSFNEIYEAFNALQFNTIKRLKKDADKVAGEEVKKIRDDVKKKLTAVGKETFSMSPQEIDDSLKHMYPYMKELSELVIEFNDEYSEAKRDRGILDFNDLEHFCLEILTDKKEDGSVVPSNVALGFKEKFEYVMVDEYQDSNTIQETIINMVSRKFGENPNVFMVGDVKQSIYRFRQAKPELFLDKYSKYSKEEDSKNRKILLFKNFRSRQEVISAVNFIFKQLMSEYVGELNYDEREALNLGADFPEADNENTVTGGPVEVNIIDKESTTEAQGNSYNETEDSVNEEEQLDRIQLEARFVALRIKKLINEERFNVYDKELKKYRRVSYRDIVILMRTTAQWAPVFMDELSENGIPVYADSNTGYFQTVEIRTVMSLLQIIDNPYQDIPLLAVLRSPIFGFTEEELIDIRLIDEEKYFFENMKDVKLNYIENDIKILSKPLTKKVIDFIEKLNEWRNKSVHMPIDKFIWYLYDDTSYFGYIGAMPNGMQRQANLKMLFQRASQYEMTSFKGLFNFINYINKLQSSSGDMGSAKILGENENVVRIMSIHKSKGLEFPVVFLCGCGKQFNLMDLNKKFLYHEELGYGPDYIDYDRRLSFQTLKKLTIKKKFKLESLSEEMRILYVAFTRAKEKLIITGSVNNIEKSCEKWCNYSSGSGEKISKHEVIKGKNYLDWICTALSRHKHGQKIREASGKQIDIIENDELSTWSVNFIYKTDVIVDKNLEDVDNFLEDDRLFINLDSNDVEEKEVRRRLDWKYKYIESSKVPANISVSEIKRSALEEEEDVFNVYDASEVKRPRFLQQENKLSGAERGTAVHFVMQHINLNNTSSIEDIKREIDIMVKENFITENQAEAVKPDKIFAFFKSSLGQRLLEASNVYRIYREVPFYIDIPATEVNKELSKEIYADEKVRLQGVIDCYFEEEDGIVLLDYKTDYVDEDGTDKIKDRYRIQIDYYSDTIEKILNKEVKNKYLYLFYTGDIVEM